jgi:hypothetical protein
MDLYTVSSTDPSIVPHRDPYRLVLTYNLISCPSNAVASHCAKAKKLKEALKGKGFPDEIFDALQHRIAKWIIQKTHQDHWVKALTAGSLNCLAILLTIAFTEPFQMIGWPQLFHGVLSKYWGVQ